MTGEEKQKVGAVIAAGGFSQRMGEVDKVFAPLCGKPLLAQAIEVFQRSNLGQSLFRYQLFSCFQILLVKDNHNLVNKGALLEWFSGAEQKRLPTEQGEHFVHVAHSLAFTSGNDNRTDFFLGTRHS